WRRELILFFSERPHQLVAQRLDQVGHQRAVAGLDEGFDRHARRQLDRAEAPDLLGVDGNAHKVEANAGALVDIGIGGDALDGAVELRRGALIEGREAQHHRLAERHHIDVLGLDLDLDRQRVGLRHDQHDLVAGRDHAADRICRRLKHGAVLRRADVDAAELIFRRYLALDELADLAVGLAQFLGDVAGELLIDLEDLQLDLGNPALGLRGIGDQRTALALDLGLVALQRREPIELDQVSLPKVAHARELLGDEAELLGLGLLLREEPGDLLLQLLDALLQLIFLPEPGGAPQFEQLALGIQRILDVRIVDVAGKLARHRHDVGAVAFGAEASLARIELVEAFGDDGEIGARHGLVEPDQNIAGLDPIAVVHAHLADHAAGRMLHLLDVGIDDDGALRDQGARDLRGRSPAAQAERQHRHQHAADDDMLADRNFGARRRTAELEATDFQIAELVDHADPPFSGTTFNARGGGVGWITRLRISSFGPNCCWRPLAMTRM